MITAVSILEGARFACQGSGACCGGYVYGPIEDAVVRVVRAHRFTENGELLNGPADPFERTEIDGEFVRVLRRVDGRCVFLSRTNKCLIHQEISPEAKPGLCRAYPFNVALAPNGVAYVSLNMECAGFADGSHGTLLEDTLEEDLPVLLAMPTQRVPPRVAWAGGVTLDFESALAVEEAWLADLEAPDRAVAACVRDLCARWAEADLPAPGGGVAREGWLGEGWLGEGGLGEGGLGEGGLGEGGLGEGWLGEGWLGGARAVAAPLIEAIRIVLGETVAVEQARGNLIDVALNRRGTDAAVAWLEGASPVLGTRAGDAGDALMRLQLRNVVFGKALHRAPTVGAGLGLEVAKLALGAVLAEQLAGGAPVTPHHVNEGLRTLNRCLRLSGLDELGEDAAASAEALACALGG